MLTLYFFFWFSVSHCHFYSLPVLHPSPIIITTFIACLPTTPVIQPPTPKLRRTLLPSPRNICLSEMKRKCLPAGSQVAHPGGWLRLMPVIQLCWFTPHTHRGAGDYTVLCWRRWGRQTKREREAKNGNRVKETEGKRRMSWDRWSPEGPLVALYLLVPDHAFHYHLVKEFY